jgi:acetolactate synthase regulatory subunit
MNTLVARVLRVLRGHSTAMIHAVDKDTHEHKLEVPVESARAVAAGQILVLQWSVHDVPGAQAQEVEVIPLVEPPSATATRPTTAAGVIESTPGSDGDAQLEALLGLRPGRLRGTGPTDFP